MRTYTVAHKSSVSITKLSSCSSSGPPHQSRYATLTAPSIAGYCPHDNPNSMPIRWALYRLLVQGFWRCQGFWSFTPTLYNIPPDRREFYNGRPLWKIDGRLKVKPWGHCRRIDPAYGAFCWTDADSSEPIEDEAGNRDWDTPSFCVSHDE